MTRVEAKTESLLNSTAGASADERIATLEMQLRSALEEVADLRARDQLKTQFLANISHDLRTPLTAVITHAEILRDGILGPLGDRQMESVNGIITGGRQLLDMVGEILAYAKGNAGQLRVTRSAFPLHEVVQQVVVTNESLA